MGEGKGILKAEPYLILGDLNTDGFRVPSGRASSSTMYGPRGVFYDGSVLVVSDTGNHRVLIWYDLPSSDGAPADIVLGQPDFVSDSPNSGGKPGTGMYMPCGVLIHEGKLFVADSWNHRILVWDELPHSNGQPPDHVIGQPDLNTTEPHTGESILPHGFFWCFGLGFAGEYLLVCDTGNRRILGWKGIPDYGDTPDLLLGQDDFYSYDENRGGKVGQNTFLWPHSVSYVGGMTFIADAGNHRVFGYKGLPQDSEPPSVLLGQRSFHEALENPYSPQSASSLRFPYGVSGFQDILAVADTANSRVLLWTPLPEEGVFLPAQLVLGQEDFQSHGENRWKRVERDTLCWCYGIHVHEETIVVADTGNNRVTLWRIDM